MYNYILHDVGDNLLLVLPLLFVLLLKLQQLLQLVAAHHQPEHFTVKDHFFDGTSDFAALLVLGRPGLDRLMSSTGQVGDSTSWRGGGLGGAQRQIVHLIANHCFWYKHICGGGRRSKAHDC